MVCLKGTDMIIIIISNCLFQNGEGNEHFQAFKKHAAEVFVHNDEADKEWIAEINEFALEVRNVLGCIS